MSNENETEAGNNNDTTVELEVTNPPKEEIKKVESAKEKEKRENREIEDAVKNELGKEPTLGCKDCIKLCMFSAPDRTLNIQLFILILYFSLILSLNISAVDITNPSIFINGVQTQSCPVLNIVSSVLIFLGCFTSILFQCFCCKQIMKIITFLLIFIGAALYEITAFICYSGRSGCGLGFCGYLDSTIILGLCFIFGFSHFGLRDHLFKENGNRLDLWSRLVFWYCMAFLLCLYSGSVSITGVQIALITGLSASIITITAAQEFQARGIDICGIQGRIFRIISGVLLIISGIDIFIGFIFIILQSNDKLQVISSISSAILSFAVIILLGQDMIFSSDDERESPTDAYKEKKDEYMEKADTIRKNERERRKTEDGTN